eukprot:TRINITY_DN2624_c0_g1_i1.p1 TRINITY_DN2624_c0_g1~~TRINITY_DN2624_c0_g1_i1.p1  ORF type:complete len:1555 (-),score=571.21 TRINITY_DN2624_c0_g1_i1:63-4487(-)
MKHQIEGSEAFKKSRCDFYLVADFLAEPIQLWNNDVTIVGKKQLGELPDSEETKQLVKDQLMFEVGGGIVAVNMGDFKTPSIIQHLSGKAIFTMERGKTYGLEEGDIIYLSEGSEGKPLFPLTLIASTANRTFTKTSFRDIVEWLPSVVDLPASDSPLVKDEAKIAGRRLNYRTLQYRLQKQEMTNASDESLCPENLLYTMASMQLYDNPESFKDIRSEVANWLSKNGETELHGLPKLSSLVKSKSWEEYVSSINPENKSGIPGDGLSLVAIAEVYSVEILVITSDPRTDYVVKITPNKVENRRNFVLGYLDHLNFVSLIQPAGESSTVSAWNTTDLIDERELMIEDLLGKGSSGHVYSAMWNGFRVATKKILNIDRKKRDAFLKETLFLRKLRHPNIYLFMGTCIRDGDLYIVTEYMEKGSLKTMLAKEKKRLNWQLVLRMALDIASGMNYLHSYKPIIIHRDLKTGNILVDKDLNLKICDFGVAKFMQKENKVTRNYFSTVAWSSPELLENGGYTEKADIYSFGLVLWSILTGVEPWETKNEFQTIYAVLTSDERPIIPEGTIPKVKELIEICWAREPSVRPPFGKIIEMLRKIKDDPTSDTFENLPNWKKEKKDKVEDEESNPLMREMKALQSQLQEEIRKNKELLVRSSPGASLMPSDLRSNSLSITSPVKTIGEVDPMNEITAALERNSPSKLQGVEPEELRSRIIEMWNHEKTITEMIKNGAGDLKLLEKLKFQVQNSVQRLWEETDPMGGRSMVTLEVPKSPKLSKRSRTPEPKTKVLSNSTPDAGSASPERTKPIGTRRGSISSHFMRSSPDLKKEISLDEALKIEIPEKEAAPKENKRVVIQGGIRRSSVSIFGFGKSNDDASHKVPTSALKAAHHLEGKRGSLPEGADPNQSRSFSRRSFINFFKKGTDAPTSPTSSSPPNPFTMSMNDADRRKHLLPRPSLSETNVTFQHPDKQDIQPISPLSPIKFEVPVANTPIKKTLSKSSSDLPSFLGSREEKREGAVSPTEESLNNASFRPITPLRELESAESGIKVDLTLSMGTSSSSNSSFPSYSDLARKMSDAVSLPSTPVGNPPENPFSSESSFPSDPNYLSRENVEDNSNNNDNSNTDSSPKEEESTKTEVKEEEPKVVAPPVIADEPAPVPQNVVQMPDGLNAVWAIDFSELQFDKEKDEIGSGNSAVVYKGMFRGQRVAIKILQNEPDFAEFKKEIDILSFVRSPEICYFYGACVSPVYCIVAEFMGRGSLYNVMEDPKYKFTWKRVLRFATQAAASLNSLHNWKPTIVHRDIKSHNMLVDANSILKIADLGLSRFTTFDNQDTLFRARGSLAYMAPEVWTSSSSKVGLGFTTKSDVYSYAIVLWEMMWRCYHGKWRIPYPNLFPFAIVTQVSKMNKRPDLDPGMPKPLIKLVQLCWDADPTKRPDCGQIVALLEEITAEFEENPSEWGHAPPRPSLSESRQASLRKMAVS